MDNFSHPESKLVHYVHHWSVDGAPSSVDDYDKKQFSKVMDEAHVWLLNNQKLINEYEYEDKLNQVWATIY